MKIAGIIFVASGSELLEPVIPEDTAIRKADEVGRGKYAQVIAWPRAS